MTNLPLTLCRYKLILVTAIIQKENPILRQIAKEVPIKEIRSEEIQKVLSLMQKSLRTQKDGVAIAAPQIGVSLRIFIVSGKVFDMEDGKLDEEKTQISPDLVCINPVLGKLSREKHEVEEGCLSVRYLYGKIIRSKKATVTAYNEKGEKFTRGASGLLSQIFQHETDHLNGVLFIDKAKDLVDLPPEKR